MFYLRFLSFCALLIGLGACNRSSSPSSSAAANDVPNMTQQSTQQAVQQTTQQAVMPSINSNSLSSGSTTADNITASPVNFKPLSPTIVSDTTNCVQVAILLDTSNSMDGLIDQAKSQLWKIVNEIALARDAKGNVPQLLLAIYDYGNDRYNAAEGYIQQIAPLTSDLDAISERLFALTTNGGSEYCGHVIRTATNALSWTKSPDRVKLIFIAGNEEFTQGTVDYQQSCRNAIAKGIVVNTIFCGDYQEGINTKWKDGADLADGKYLNIDQDQKVVHIDAPQDTELNRLNQQLNDTYMGYGAEGESSKMRQTVQDSNAGAYGSANASMRAVSKASAAYKNDSWDVVDAVKEKKIDLKKMEQDELPQEMRSLKPEEREAYVARKAAERETIQARIRQLSEERRHFVDKKEREMREADPNANTLDVIMLRTIREQLTARGLHFEK